MHELGVVRRWGRRLIRVRKFERWPDARASCGLSIDDRPSATRGLATLFAVSSDSIDRRARLTIAIPPLDAAARLRAVDDDWHLKLLSADDPDERSVLIRLAHPELDDAIREGKETVVVGGEEMNPRLHLAVHEVVATQIVENDPPEALQTAQRLLRLGRDHHEVLHMLGFVVSGQIWGAMHEQREYSRAEHVRALEALPQSFDAEFARSPNRAARRAHARRGRRGHGR